MTLIDSILFVDDDPIVNFHHITLTNSLKIAREIFVKTNGHDALEFIKGRYYSGQSLPSLILLDMNMPIMNGMEFIEELQTSDLLGVRKIPVVILSNVLGSTEEINITRFGFNSISKPLSSEKLTNIIQYYLPSDFASSPTE